ncbi:MAG: site-specific integrase [Candidatus Dormibacteraeota bacterium]|nr:site-specific integrase [Candidatus Dormibacteraeota bacterium]
MLDPIEAGRLISAARDDRLGSMAVLALATGMRMGEVLGLRWCDVDLDAGVLRVTYALQRVDGKLALVQPKTERSRRVIPLPAVAVDALRRRRSQWQDDQLAAGGQWKGTVGDEPAAGDPVFANVNGTLLSPERAWHAFKRLLRSAGLPESIRFHDLRHSAASLLLASGVPMREVADVLGHSSTALLGSTYGHVVPSLRRSARVMDSLLGDTE